MKPFRLWAAACSHVMTDLPHGRHSLADPIRQSERGDAAFDWDIMVHLGDLWLGGHTHAPPDDAYGGKSHIERGWGVTFVNVAALTKYHVMGKAVPMSRLLTFEPSEASVNVRCYLHTSDHAPQGWYAPAERNAPLRHAFAGI